MLEANNFTLLEHVVMEVNSRKESDSLSNIEKTQIITSAQALLMGGVVAYISEAVTEAGTELSYYRNLPKDQSKRH